MSLRHARTTYRVEGVVGAASSSRWDDGIGLAVNLMSCRKWSQEGSGSEWAVGAADMYVYAYEVGSGQVGGGSSGCAPECQGGCRIYYIRNVMRSLGWAMTGTGTGRGTFGPGRRGQGRAAVQQCLVLCRVVPSVVRPVYWSFCWRGGKKSKSRQARGCAWKSTLTVIALHAKLGR